MRENKQWTDAKILEIKRRLEFKSNVIDSCKDEGDDDQSKPSHELGLDGVEFVLIGVDERRRDEDVGDDIKA